MKHYNLMCEFISSIVCDIKHLTLPRLSSGLFIFFENGTKNIFIILIMILLFLLFIIIIEKFYYFSKQCNYVPLMSLNPNFVSIQRKCICISEKKLGSAGKVGEYPQCHFLDVMNTSDCHLVALGCR